MRKRLERQKALFRDTVQNGYIKPVENGHVGLQLLHRMEFVHASREMAVVQELDIPVPEELPQFGPATVAAFPHTRVVRLDRFRRRPKPGAPLALDLFERRIRIGAQHDCSEIGKLMRLAACTPVEAVARRTDGPQLVMSVAYVFFESSRYRTAYAEIVRTVEEELCAHLAPTLDIGNRVIIVQSRHIAENHVAGIRNARFTRWAAGCTIEVYANLHIRAYLSRLLRQAIPERHVSVGLIDNKPLAFNWHIKLEASAAAAVPHVAVVFAGHKDFRTLSPLPLCNLFVYYGFVRNAYLGKVRNVTRKAGIRKASLSVRQHSKKLRTFLVQISVFYPSHERMSGTIRHSRFISKGRKLIHLLVGIVLPLLLAEMKFLRDIGMRTYGSRRMREKAYRRNINGLAVFVFFHKLDRPALLILHLAGIFVPKPEFTFAPIRTPCRAKHRFIGDSKLNERLLVGIGISIVCTFGDNIMTRINLQSIEIFLCSPRKCRRIEFLQKSQVCLKLRQGMECVVMTAEMAVVKVTIPIRPALFKQRREGSVATFAHLRIVRLCGFSRSTETSAPVTLDLGERQVRIHAETLRHIHIKERRGYATGCIIPCPFSPFCKHLAVHLPDVLFSAHRKHTAIAQIVGAVPEILHSGLFPPSNRLNRIGILKFRHEAERHVIGIFNLFAPWRLIEPVVDVHCNLHIWTKLARFRRNPVPEVEVTVGLRREERFTRLVGIERTATCTTAEPPKSIIFTKLQTLRLAALNPICDTEFYRLVIGYAYL